MVGRATSLAVVLAASTAVAEVDRDPGPAPAGPAPAPVSALESESAGHRALKWLPTLLFAGASIAVELLVDPPSKANFRGSNGFDSGIRSGLLAGSPGARETAREVSDYLEWGLEGLLVADWIWLRDEHGLADSLRIDAGYYFANRLATQGAKLAAARERPYVRECESDPDYVGWCDSDTGNQAFWSGHASTSATTAGLVCARHLGRDERGWLDVSTCAAALSGSLATGLLRIAADKHHATDVLAGWASGALFGYVLPSRFHYRRGEAAALGPAGGTAWGVASRISPVVQRDYFGLRYDVRF